MYRDLKYFAIPLPEDVQKLKMYGDFEGAKVLIDYLLTKDLTKALKERLLMEKDVLNVMGVSEYPYTFADAIAIMRKNIRDFKDEELKVLKEISAADWIYVDGAVHFQRRFYANLIKTRPEYAARELSPDLDDAVEKKQDMLNENVRQMKENGGRTARIHLRTSLKVRKEFEQVGSKVSVHLPIPKDCIQVSELEILKTSHEIARLAPGDAGQRTVYFETVLKEDEEFFVEYRYVNHVNYVELDPAKAAGENVGNRNVDNGNVVRPHFDTVEQSPHIRFTPYLSMLLEEILEGETNPVRKARKIYDYVTTHVMYSFMREYFCIENISEYAAINGKGDCGVQAILFITLCRMAGIPAKWQSGLYVTESYTGCHDWAQFYVAPYGWVFADLSFGGSAWRAGETERWNYYFGNLDVFRMPANSEIQSEFIPPKEFLRGDPIDNQVGELEYEKHGLLRAQTEHVQELIELTDI